MLVVVLDAQQQGGNVNRALGLWRANGGDPSLVDVAREHHHWLQSLPTTTVRGRYRFVHPGVRPFVVLERQHHDDLIWIRRPFLDAPKHGLPYTVVHGHTFRSDYRITRLPHRIDIDTGAYLSGRLTALPLAIQPSP